MLFVIIKHVLKFVSHTTSLLFGRKNPRSDLVWRMTAWGCNCNQVSNRSTFLEINGRVLEQFWIPGIDYASHEDNRLEHFALLSSQDCVALATLLEQL